ncbi:MAG TPA: SDR family NAD(P)-dependent oxidoreductase, partial [Reyranella sp.]
MRGLDGKNVIVTGGGGAIGGAICRRFAGYGASVGVFDKNLDGANKVADEIRKDGGKAFVSGADIADYD